MPAMVQILNLVLASLTVFRQATLLRQIEPILTHLKTPRPLPASRRSKELLGLLSHYRLSDH